MPAKILRLKVPGMMGNKMHPTTGRSRVQISLGVGVQGETVGEHGTYRLPGRMQETERVNTNEREPLQERIDELQATLETAQAWSDGGLGTPNSHTIVLEGVNRVLQGSLDCETEEDLGGICLAVAEELTGSKFGFIGATNANGKLDDIAISDPGWELCRVEPSAEHRRVPTGFSQHGIYGRVLLDGKGFYTNDPVSHPDSIGLPEGHPPLSAFLGVPLVQGDKIIGMLAVGNREGGYREEDLAALEALAPAIAQVLTHKRAEEERARLLERVQESELQYHALFTSMSEAFVLLRVLRDEAGVPADLVYLDINPTYEKATGRSRDQQVGKMVSSLFPEVVPFWLGVADQVFGSGEPLRLQRYNPPSGTWMDLVAYSPGEDLIAALMTNITKRKQAEEELRKSETSLKRAQEIAHLGSWELDTVLSRLTWSDEVYRIFGLEPQEFDASYEAFLERVHPDDRGAVDAAYSGSLRDNLDSYEIEHRVIRKSTGEIRIVHEKCEHVRDQTGRIILSVGMVHDITERKAAEIERERLLVAEHEARSLAERAVKVRDEFMSVAAHELKTPVTSLQGYAQVLMRQYQKTGSLDPARVLKSTKAIDDQCKRLTSLTEQLLNLSRLETGKLILVKQERDLGVLIENLVSSIRHAHPGRSIELRDGKGIVAEVDPLRFEQVVTNLIDNALKFSAHDAPVGVEIGGDRPGWAKISIRDHGIGIPEEKRARVFERFFQAHPERHYGGMGIGLSISRQIAEMHGGRITLEQPEDGGSRFVVHMPTSSRAEPLGGEMPNAR